MQIELSPTEENYLKHIYHIENEAGKLANTNALACALGTTAASTSDMISRLSKKGLVSHEKYKGVGLTAHGRYIAIELIRKHRLWEVFLVNVLGFGWEQVHDVAEQLEHVNSDLLINRLDQFLGFPTSDPHGDPIPTQEGKIQEINPIALLDLEENQVANVVHVKQDKEEFLKYCSKIGLFIGARIEVLEKVQFDKSVKVIINNQTHHLPNIICKEINVTLG